PSDEDVTLRLLAALQHDRQQVQRYRYVESSLIEKRDRQGRLRSSSAEVHELSFEDGRWVKRSIARDNPEDPETVAMVHGEESRFLRTETRPTGPARKADPPLNLEKLLDCFHLHADGRDTYAGRPAEKVSFAPVEGCLQDDSRAGRLLQHLEGTLWMDEESSDLLHLEGRLQRPVSFGFGILGRVDSLAIEMDREALAPGTYATMRIEYRARGVIFLFNKFDIRSVRQRSGFVLATPPAPKAAGAPPPTAEVLPHAPVDATRPR
ncbi:MAG TPA: hypothetical protein VNL37_01970, partial [Candidatus Polarisedimenticolia bacterium]|nr:hypothetical protein [Candidatus Polarisedimenticolia bacterium]